MGIFIPSLVYTQSNIVSGEYFFDTDPGIGNATAIPAFTSAANIDVDYLASSSSLSIGMHLLGIRLIDDTDLWSMTEFIPVFVTPNDLTALSNITEIRYFFDDDPGIGNGNLLTLSSPATAVDIDDLISTTGLTTGIHTLYIRVKTVNNQWSISEGIPALITFSGVTTLTNITNVEYFIDKDPGIGLGAPLTLPSPGTPIDIDDLIPTDTLSTGIHTLYIRVKSERDVWSIPEAIPVLITYSGVTSLATITDVEYFIDKDPGIGLGAPLTLPSPGINIDIDDLIPTDTLSTGIHTLYIRVKSDRNVWSIPEAIPVLITYSGVTSLATITDVEYFIDKDPGIGLGAPLTLPSPATNIDIDDLIPTDTLSTGIHTLYIRVKSDRNVWSIPEQIPVLITYSGVTSLATITDVEYFFDTDPGIGSGNLLTLPVPGTSIDIDDLIPTSSLSLGIHTLYIRVKSDRNVWSMAEAVPVLITSSGITVLENVSEAEYFFDADPGFGNGTPLTIAPGMNVTISDLVPTAGLSIGMHNFYIRVKTGAGLWSLPEVMSFYVDQNLQITQVEYFFDSDPGPGNATKINLSTPSDLLVLDFLASTIGLSIGTHTMGMRVGGQNDIWGQLETRQFDICDGAIALITSTDVCFGDQSLFTDISQNVVAGDVYSWDFESDGIIDTSTVGNTNFTYPTAGPFTASLIIDRLGCKDSTGYDVNIGSPAMANASAVQNLICEGDIVSLSASYSGNATSGSWTSSGDGTFDDPASLTPIYTPGSNDITLGTANLFFVTDDPVGACLADTATVSISINTLPIVDAGIAASVCSTENISLAGAITGSVATGTWSTAGSGSFDDPTNLNATYTPSLADISSGTLTFTLTSDAPPGPCGPVQSLVVYTLDAAPIANAGADASICADDSYTLSGLISGSATSGSWSTSGTGTFSDSTSLTAVYTPSSADINNGSVQLTLTSNDPPGVCTAVVDNLVLTLDPLPVANAGVDITICESSTVQLIGSISGSATSASWSTDGSGTFDDPTNLMATYTPSSTDIANTQVTLTLSTNDPPGLCAPVSDQMYIIFNSDVVVDPIADIYVCMGENIPLDPLVIGNVSSVNWSTNGSGSFDNPLVLNTNYQLSAADDQSGEVTLTLTITPAGTCSPQNILVQVFVNHPFDMIGQNISTDVLESNMVDVTIGGTFNPGEGLTMTILQQPIKGTIQIDSTTLTYIPSIGTVGADSVRVQLCNSCGFCDSDFIRFDIRNQPPAFTPPDAGVEPNTSITFNLSNIVSDLNDNIDFSTFEILIPPLSGATVTIDENNNILIDYSGTNFTGSDRFIFQICDTFGECTIAQVDIEVAPFDVEIFNAVSPNNDQIHDFFKIVNIEKFPNNVVSIFNRWGDKVYEVEYYDNVTNIFEGKSNQGAKRDLPDGTYYYVIHLKKGKKNLSGFLVLRR